MAQIPLDIAPDILPLLPAESLLRFRAVCRDWRNRIDDKSFIDSHAISSQKSSTTLLIRNPTSSRLYSIFIDSLMDSADDHDQENLEATSIPAFSCPRFSRMPDFPLPSCNGLILLHIRNPKKNWLIVNPLTQKFLFLPHLPLRVGYTFAGLGYDSSSNDYKVVAIGLDLPEAYRFIYSMKSDRWSWMRIEDVDANEISPRRRDGVFLDGFLHWKSMRNYSVTRFDLATECFDEVVLPETEGEVSFWDCGLLDGCLAVSLFYEKGRCLEGWVMTEGEWTKLFSIENSVGFMRPIAYLKRRKGLVLLTTWCSKKLFLLDIEKNSLRMVQIQGLPDEISSIMCFSGSLLPLEDSYDFIGKRSREPKGANARLKLSVKTMDFELID